MKEELLFNEIYEKTKNCGRTQFVRLLMDKERENKELKKQLERSEKARKEAIDYINKKANKGYNFGWILQNEEIDKLLEILDILNKGE